ncbi:MAG: hypothetical protein JW908_04385 [Anaerolineales bacterium]|nr:hypothetical protein [Anaerolineales bacterium]
MSYADWTFYSTSYLGTEITQAEFSALAVRASALIDMFTFNRAGDETDVDTVTKIKFAMCAVAEELKAQTSHPGGIESERVGSHSVTYAPNSEMQLSNHQKLSNAAKIYLSGTALMFPGFADGEYGGEVDED